MASTFLTRLIYGPKGAGEAQVSSRRSEAVQRMLIGCAGILFMVMVISLATVIRDRADQTDAEAAPEAAATVAAESDEPQMSDPLAEAGLVPDLPSEAEEAEQAELAEQAEQAEKMGGALGAGGANSGDVGASAAGQSGAQDPAN